MKRLLALLFVVWVSIVQGHFFGPIVKEPLEIGSIPIREKNLEATTHVPHLPYGPPYTTTRTFIHSPEVGYYAKAQLEKLAY